MAKLQSTLLNMTLSLTLISVVAAGLLGLVYVQAKPHIDKAEADAQAAAKVAVLPGINDVVVATEAREADGVRIYDATVNGTPCGAAIEVHENGFGGDFALMVGLNPEGQILGYKVLSHQETPGLGSKMQEWFSNPDKAAACVIGRTPGDKGLTVSKDGGEVDAITAATISSRAFLKAVNKAAAAYAQSTEANSGATKQEHHCACGGKCEHHAEGGEHQCVCGGHCQHHNNQ